ncbi:hydroxymethylglutaryl-CoA reductase [Spirosoma horti]|uniref:hydroxymethylglutaryl-CoA reductase (NADPH) n=1 Tax=Spirosoma pollinicola TaxID=2057025 RepID=A0A2K8Z6D7_9BACT|nr:hydroxymethylglutaryl-CoA reductase [Spirosoma pollinicola]AUD05435.1 hydroxymethylglutaryl-CoA reductase [Spirosoma pollinicola]RZM30514.1 MAG: hydroxymethylglutaryl-CoA reductase [Pedobacter sp.]
MFRFIPNVLLKQLYTRSSLRNTPTGFTFSLKNRLADAQFTGLTQVRIDGEAYPVDAFTLELDGQEAIRVSAISTKNPLKFPLRRKVTVQATAAPLITGRHTIELILQSQPFGRLTIMIEDELQVDQAQHQGAGVQKNATIPRHPVDDMSPEIIRERQDFLRQYTQTLPNYLTTVPFDPALVRGNCEQFVGVAQVPIGLVGPLRINGEHAQGDFLIPLATTEGTLVASYNRGIKLLNQCGGVTCTVLDEGMQRAPVFVMHDARAARDLSRWVADHEPELRSEAESTSRFARLRYITPYQAGRMLFLRFGYTTGDAAGQNMVSKATLAACNYLLQQVAGVEHFYLESNMATDKKPSFVNTLQTRGKRVTAEVTIPKDLLLRELQVEPEQLDRHARIGNVGAFMAGTNNNGLHSVNGLAALFIATGQDVACLAESSAAITTSELLPNGDLYGSITLPSLIVGTVGGGTGLPTQQECLNILGCSGTGQVYKFAEIVAGVVAAGELSLAAAISSLDWVSSHESARQSKS